MSRWLLRTSADFDRSVRKLDRPVAVRIKEYLAQICDLEDPRSRGKALTGNLSGYWRYRVGSYRILMTVHDDEFVLIALDVAHRADVYDNR
jgi:mRNA interferase RelE/StbE